MLKIVFLHAREDPKIGPEPKFHASRPSNGKDQGDNRKGVNFQHGTIWEAPLKIKKMKIGLRSDLSWPKLGLEPKFHESETFGGFGKRGQSLSRIFNTGPYGDPLKIKIMKIRLRHVLSWLKLRLEPKCHVPNGKGGVLFMKQSTISVIRA